MLITCPSCSAAYDLPIERIGGAGRKVRCVSCRESWFVASPEGDLAAARPSLDDDPGVEIVARAEPRRTPRAAPAAAATRPRGSRAAKTRRSVDARLLGRITALALVCMAPPALLAFREGVVSALPGTASIYRAIGLPVNLSGLAFANVASTLANENGAMVLQVTGEVVNDGRIARPVPWLHVALEGEGGEPLYAWSAKAAEGELPVGRSAPFRIRLTAPPVTARQVAVSFRDARSRRTAALE